jgi:hypothetical protein
VAFHGVQVQGPKIQISPRRSACTKNQPTIVAWWAVKSISRYRIGTIEVEPENATINRESQV